MPKPNPQPQINTLAATFNLSLQSSQISGFRGAFAALAGRKNDLFHNHNNRPKGKGAYQHRYPLIQYRVDSGQASVFAINEGVLQLERLLASSGMARFRMNGHPQPLQVTKREANLDFRPEVLSPQDAICYHVQDYQPFGQENHRIYEALPSLEEKRDSLQRMLRNHAVVCAYGLGWQLPEQQRLQVELLDLHQTRKMPAFGCQMQVFDLTFRLNARLPGNIGLGRKVAFGFGRLLALA